VRNVLCGKGYHRWLKRSAGLNAQFVGSVQEKTNGWRVRRNETYSQRTVRRFVADNRRHYGACSTHAAMAERNRLSQPRTMLARVVARMAPWPACDWRMAGKELDERALTVGDFA
jgi:hypothetical protein